jgi:hypothetical protein
VAVKIAKVTIAANTSVGILAALGQTLGTLIYAVRIYDPAESNLLLADAAGTGPLTDPEATFPILSYPYVVDATRDDIFIFNPNAASVSVVCMAWIRQAA